MASARGHLFLSLLIFLLTGTCYGEVLFSSLKQTLVITASPKAGELLKAGKNSITVTWGLNQSFPSGTDADYKTVKVKLCYAPISQKDRSWRKVNDNLAKDKTCQFLIAAKPYTSSNTTFDWIIERHVPTATYFVRAYALNAQGTQVGYGQTTNTGKKTNLFQIDAISGRHVSMDIASICFSAFSVVSLFGFFYIEKRKAKAEQQK